MNEIPTLSERPGGKIPSTTVTNEITRAVLAMMPSFKGGQSFEPWSLRWQIGVVTDAGPKSAANYTNERYWVILSHIDHLDSLTEETATPETHITTSYVEDDTDIITATNLAELGLDKEEGDILEYEEGTHMVPPGTHVQVFFDSDGNGNTRAYFNHPVNRVVRFSITGASSIAGVYEAEIAIEPGAFNPSTGVNGSWSTADSMAAYAINHQEFGLSLEVDHQITEGDGDGVGRFFGVVRSNKSTDGKFVIDFNGFDGSACDAEE